MFKMTIVALSCALLGLLACSSSGGVSEGGECGGPQDDCGTNLTCMPIQGRGHAYCCPTPPESSGEDNCHPIRSASDGTPR
jgi:hypothetical protein